jgi:hypothetical protein
MMGGGERTKNSSARRMPGERSHRHGDFLVKPFRVAENLSASVGKFHCSFPPYRICRLRRACRSENQVTLGLYNEMQKNI